MRNWSCFRFYLLVKVKGFQSVTHSYRDVYVTKAPFTPTGDVWRCTGDQQFWTHRQCIARRRQTTSVHCHYIVSGRQPSSTLRQAWRFFWNVQKNRQASPTIASEYSVVKWLSALRQPSPSYSSSSPMRR